MFFVGVSSFGCRVTCLCEVIGRSFLWFGKCLCIYIFLNCLSHIKLSISLGVFFLCK